MRFAMGFDGCQCIATLLAGCVADKPVNNNQPTTKVAKCTYTTRIRYRASL